MKKYLWPAIQIILRIAMNLYLYFVWNVSLLGVLFVDALCLLIDIADSME